MKEVKHIESPTGCVHIADTAELSGKFAEYTTLCNHNNYHGSYGSGFWHRWPLTNKQVTCRRCLSLSDDPAYKLKELTIKASDLESDFNRLASKCKHFKLEDNENAQIFHSLPLKLCWHRNRLGTPKYPKKCNIIDCPLKYER